MSEFNNSRKLTINLDNHIMEIAEQKAKVKFKGNIENYINWLICTNNESEVKKKVEELEKNQEKDKAVAIPDTVIVARYKNVCDYCKEVIYQGEEICKAEFYEYYIHKRCCK